MKKQKNKYKKISIEFFPENIQNIEFGECIKNFGEILKQEEKDEREGTLLVKIQKLRKKNESKKNKLLNIFKYYSIIF